MTELTTYRENNTMVPSADGWDDAAAEAGQRVLRGTLLKFADWKWTRGKEATPVADGAELTALATAAAWVKWQGGKPVEYRMREPGKFLPDREDLGDMNTADWEKGPDGQPRDPWQNTRFVYLVDKDTAEAFTYSTSSYGGRDAVTALGDQIARMRSVYPDAVPIVAMGAAGMPTKYGRKSRPVLKVVGWHGAAPPRQLGDTVSELNEQRLAAPTRSQELDDEIPF